MDLSSVRRVSSAGYRLPERNKDTGPVLRKPEVDRSRRATGDAFTPEKNPDQRNTVKQDRVWTELVWAERRAVHEWEKNWGFLKNYDQLGNLKPEEPSPGYVSLFTDRVPNTTNQLFGSRLSTPLGRELVGMERLMLWSGGNHKRKMDPDMQPC